jgi:hypothetical protein
VEDARHVLSRWVVRLSVGEGGTVNFFLCVIWKHTGSRRVTILISEIGPSWRCIFKFASRLLYPWKITQCLIGLRVFMGSRDGRMIWRREISRVLVSNITTYHILRNNSNKNFSLVNIENSPSVKTPSVCYVIMLLLSQWRHAATYRPSPPKNLKQC